MKTLKIVLSILLVVLLVKTGALQDSLSDDSEKLNDEEVIISPKCSAVLLTVGASAGAGVAYAATPSLMCTAGFCPVGVSAGSFASWWQSTLPLVAKGSLFSQLQALAMGGVGTEAVTITGAMLGSTVAAKYLQDFCAYVDDVNPDTAPGKAITAAAATGIFLAKTGTSFVKAKQYFETECSNSEKCASFVEKGSDAAEHVMVQAKKTKDFISKKITDLGFPEKINSERYASIVEMGSDAAELVTAQAIKTKDFISQKMMDQGSTEKINSERYASIVGIGSDVAELVMAQAIKTKDFISQKMMDQGTTDNINSERYASFVEMGSNAAELVMVQAEKTKDFISNKMMDAGYTEKMKSVFSHATRGIFDENDRTK